MSSIVKLPRIIKVHFSNLQKSQFLNTALFMESIDSK